MGSIERLVKAEAVAVEDIITSLVKALVKVWSGVDDWSDRGIARAVDESVDLVEAAQLETRRLVTAYAMPLYREVGVTNFDQMDLGLDSPDYPRFEVSPRQVWVRPRTAYGMALKDGASKQEAVAKALERVASVAEMEVRLAKRDQEARVNRAAGERVIGYRRIIHPELSKSGVCGLCVVAADRVYSVGELAALHDGCNCTVAPVTKSHDPGLNLNTKDLAELYRRAGSTSRKQLSNVRIADFVSGELGPVLTKAGKEKPYSDRLAKLEATEDKRLKRLAPRDAAEKAAHFREQIAQYEAFITEAKAAGGRDGEVRWFTRKIEQLKKRLAIVEGRAVAA